MRSTVRNDFGSPETTVAHPDAPGQPDALERFAREAQALRDADDEVQRLEAALKIAKGYRDRLADVEVMEAARDADRERWVFEDGVQVQVEKRLHCSIKAGQKMDVLMWLKQIKQTALLTVTVSVAFARKDHDAAMQLVGILKREGHEPEVEYDVHSQTLKKFVGEQYFKTGLLAKLHPGITYFNDTCAVVVRPAPVEAPNAPAEENPL